MGTREERKERIIKRRKEQILDAALGVFSRKGFGEATISEIAQEAGVATGTIYNYYPSKRELLFAVIKNFIIAEPLLNLFEHTQETDYPTYFTAILKNRMDLIQESDSSRLALLMSEVQRDPELKKLYVKRVIKPVMGRMEKFYETRAASGYFRPLNAAVVTRALGGMIMGLAMLNGLEGEDSPLKRMPRQELVAELKNFILTGLQGKGEQPQEVSL
jgi:TetR/AcrR family fatty acid metabolism transcriptional regulator